MRLCGYAFLLFVFCVSSNTVAAKTQLMAAFISFDTPLTETKSNDIQFGSVTAGRRGTYIIDTDNNVTSSSGGLWLSGLTAAGKIMISGSSSQAVTISTGSYTSDHGVVPSLATCKYGAGLATPCDGGLHGTAPGAATTLLVGTRVVADGSQAAGTLAAPSFVVTVVYN